MVSDCRRLIQIGTGLFPRDRVETPVKLQCGGVGRDGAVATAVHKVWIYVQQREEVKQCNIVCLNQRPGRGEMLIRKISKRKREVGQDPKG